VLKVVASPRTAAGLIDGYDAAVIHRRDEVR
jgi:hypothetical protein